MKRTYTLAILFVLILSMAALTGCGHSNEKANSISKQEKEEKNSQEYEPVMIKAKDREIQFNEMPKRVVTFDIHPAEIMLELGLEEYIAGTAANSENVLPKYKKSYSKIPVISENMRPSMEKFLAVNPDFVYSGWESTFQKGRIGTVEELEQMNISAYAHQSSNILAPNLEDVYQDIHNIGRIFKVEDKADKLIESLKTSMSEVKQKIEDQVGVVEDPLRVFIYDSGEDAPFTATQTILSELIKIAGGKNIFDDIKKNWTTVSWEEVVKRNPEVIVIMDYGNMTVEQKKQVLFTNPSLANMDAVKNKRIYVMPLDDTFEGVRMPTTVETLAKDFYPEAFK